MLTFESAEAKLSLLLLLSMGQAPKTTASFISHNTTYKIFFYETLHVWLTSASFKLHIPSLQHLIFGIIFYLTLSQNNLLQAD